MAPNCDVFQQCLQAAFSSNLNGLPKPTNLLAGFEPFRLQFALRQVASDSGHADSVEVCGSVEKVRPQVQRNTESPHSGVDFRVHIDGDASRLCRGFEDPRFIDVAYQGG